MQICGGYEKKKIFANSKKNVFKKKRKEKTKEKKQICRFDVNKKIP